ARRLLQIVAEMAEVTTTDQQPAAHSTIIVSVIDQGHGIPPHVAEKLFSPFFSTKSGGMGMGLKICRTAIEFHGGTLTHQNNPAGGTIFQFSLPINRP
ncbi:ATP-binding protein, partial [Undibacterium sp.]|uniref:ATP-binding protein n=1 Tax=Undibacterium sp. TaxID=1914977 RepID=UPI002CD9039D